MIWTGFLRCVFASIPNCLSTADLNSIPFDALKQFFSNSANVPLCLRSLTFPISDIDGKSSNFCLPAISTKNFSPNAVMFCFSSACVAFWPVVCFVQRMEFNYEKRTKLAWCQANTPSDMLLIPTFSSSGLCWVLTKRIQWPPYPLDQKRQVLALPPLTRQHIFTWSVGQNSIFYFVWKMSLYASIRVHNLHSFNFFFVFREAEKVVNLFTCILIGLEGGRRKVCKTVELWFFFVFISFFCVLC